MIPGSKGRNVVHACMIRHLNFGPAKHEEAAIYAVNQRIPMFAGLWELRSNGTIVGISWGQNTFCPQHHSILSRFRGERYDKISGHRY